jgi:4a-hydroxytetrahydrobiopterin dehydratase
MTPLDLLAAQSCQPRRGDAHRIDASAAAARIASLPGWALIEDGAAMSKTFRFPDYYRTIAFVNALAFVAHREDHHPDLGVHYDRCIVRFSTHDVGGLSENDFICAAKAERLASTAG